MNTKTLANHYSQLTPEERFRLIMAAADRGDETEQQRLRDTGQRLTLSMPAHAPYAHAFAEVLLMTYIELLEDAALYHERHELMHKELHASIEAAKTPKRMKTTTPRTKDPTQKEDAVEFPTWHRYGRIAYGVGYLFKMKMAGWKLFCQRLNVSPFALWEEMALPGLDRLMIALSMTLGGLAFPSVAAMTCWVNEERPPGSPEYTEAEILTAAQFADDLDVMFRARAKWWAG